MYLLGNLPIPLNQSGNSLIKSSVDLMGLAASETVAGLFVATVVEAGAGCVLGCLTVMAQFFFTTASFSLESRPRIVGQGCLQHTSMILPCGGKHQGDLAAK